MTTDTRIDSRGLAGAIEPPEARAAFLARMAANADRQAVLRDLAAAGEVEPSGETPPTVMVRRRIEAALDGHEGGVAGHVVKVTAARLDAAPLLIRGGEWTALLVETVWEPNRAGYAATLVYTLDAIPF